MSDAVVIALIGAVPATIGAYATLLEAQAKRRDTQLRRDSDAAAASAAVAPPVTTGPAATPAPAPSATPGSRPHGGTALPPPRNPLRLVATVVGAVVVTVAVVLVAALVLDGDDEKGGPVDTVVRVPGDQPWTDTGIDVEAGELVRIMATGEVFHSTELGEKSGPDGKPDTGDYPTNVIDGVDHNTLIGRIGATDPFKVGSSTEFAARRDGRLWLRVNDAGIENNSGEFSAHVQVPNRPAA